MAKPSPDAEKKTWMRMIADGTTLALLLPVSTFVGYAIGRLLDKALGTRFLYLVFLILGIVAGFTQLIRQVQKDTRDNGS